MGEAAQSPGKPPFAARRRVARLVAIVIGATLLAGVLQATEASPSQAAPSGSRMATVTVDSVNPSIPTKGDTVTLTGRLTNNGKTAITDAHVGIRMPYGGALDTRSGLKSAGARTGYSYAQDGNEIEGHTTKIADLPAGGSTPFTLSVPVSDLNLTEAGAYQLGVTLEGSTPSDPSEHVVGIQRTFLPWYGDEEMSGTKATKISFMWSLTDRSHIAPRGDTDSQRSPIFMDDDLTTELAPGGRLRVLVDLPRGLTVPVTWMVDPDLLATVEFMTKGYRVAGPGGDVTKTTEGKGGTVAKQWLNDLKTAVAGDQVVALPFGDTDIASLAHNGQKVSGALAHLKTGTALGRSTVETILGITPSSDVAWPVDGAIDPSIVSVARQGGAKRIIARSDSFAEHDSLYYTPTAARPIGKGMTAVVSDATLSTMFDGSMVDPGNADVAVQSFLAQTLMITREAPERQRTILVSTPRMPSVAQAKALAQALQDTTDAPWINPVSFDDAAAAHPDPNANRTVPPAKAYPNRLRKQELPTEAYRQIQTIQGRLNDFVVILTRQDRVTVPFGNAVLRALSTNWRGDASGEQAYRDAIGLYLQDLTDAVHIIDKTTLTLSGRSGTIPVTVKNELGQPVNLVLRLKSSANIRLEIKNAAQPITIEGGHTSTLKFQTKASANGTVTIQAHLYTADKRLYGNTVTFDVHINKVTDLVMLIIGAGLLLLVLAGVRIYRQRKRMAADDNGDEDDEEAGGEGPGQPGDPAADTGQVNQEPSSTGEKVDG